MASAKQLFLNESNKNTVSYFEQAYTACLQKKYLHPVDFLCAKIILPSACPEVKFFLAYLFACYRIGHLCAIVEKERIQPSWGEYDEALIQGSQKVPLEIINQNEETHKPLFVFCNHWYLHICWDQETQIVKELQRLQETASEILLPTQDIQKKLQLSIDQGILQNEQSRAILNGCKHSLSIIFGGPGTGKSYTAAHLIKEIYQHLNADQKKIYEIAIAAPTGKAVANLRNQIFKVIPEMASHSFFKAATLHALLETKRIKKQESFLSADLLVIDECSMMDIHLMAQLLRRVKEGSRVVLIGDPEQLPPIQAGNIFREFFVDSHLISTTTLKRSLRVENNELSHFAHLIKEQKVEILANEISRQQAITYETFNELSFAIQAHILKKVTSQWHILKQWKPEASLLKEFFKRFCVLSAVRKGLLGVDTLNEALHKEHTFSLHKNEDLVIPIMIVANNADMDLYNGDLGVLVKHDSDLGQAYFMCESGLRCFQESLLPAYEYAYVQSIHKSQGSEYDHVLILLPEGSEVFGNELLYTAFTRARQKVDLFCFQNTFYQLVKNQSQRLSGIKNRWPLAL